MKTLVFNTQLKVIQNFFTRIFSMPGRKILGQILVYILLSITFPTVRGQDPSSIARTKSAAELFDRLDELLGQRFNGDYNFATGITDIEEKIKCPKLEVFAYDLQNNQKVGDNSNICYASASDGFADLCSFFGLEADKYSMICVFWKINFLLETSHNHEDKCPGQDGHTCKGDYISSIDYVQVQAIGLEGGSIEVSADPEKIRKAGFGSKILDVLNSKVVVSGSTNESAIASSRSIIITKSNCKKYCLGDPTITESGIFYEIGRKRTKTVQAGEKTVEVPWDKRDIRDHVVEEVDRLMNNYSVNTDLIGWTSSNFELNFTYPLRFFYGIGLGAGYYFGPFNGPKVNTFFEYEIPLNHLFLKLESGFNFCFLNAEVKYTGTIMDTTHMGYIPYEYKQTKSIFALPFYGEVGILKKFGREQRTGLEASVGGRVFLTANLPETAYDNLHNKFSPYVKAGSDYKKVQDAWNGSLFNEGFPLYFKLKFIYYFKK